jgi:hypothetical protein
MINTHLLSRQHDIGGEGHTMKQELGNFQSVEQMDGRNGPVKNQFIIQTDKGLVFQSYQTIIAAKIQGKVYLDQSSWDYSVTTGKYRNLFLRETKAETERKIKNGEYILCDLN